ncbi:glycerate kinase [Acinetobacter baumannii]
MSRRLYFCFDKRDEAGSGVAGGLGFAAKSYLNADFKAGVKVVAEPASA